MQDGHGTAGAGERSTSHSLSEPTSSIVIRIASCRSPSWRSRRVSRSISRSSAPQRCGCTTSPPVTTACCTYGSKSIGPPCCNGARRFSSGSAPANRHRETLTWLRSRQGLLATRPPTTRSPTTTPSSEGNQPGGPGAGAHECAHRRVRGRFQPHVGVVGNPALDYTIPCTVQVTQFGGGASWGLGGGKLNVTLNPGGGGVTMLRYLLVSEMTEQFMREQGRGWYGTNTEGSEGEGLSRFLAARFLAINGLGYPPPGFANSNIWMSSARNDYVNNINTTDDGPDAITGCALLFIYYLFSQLGYTINQIVAAGAPTLGGIYNKLTGDPGDPFPYFKALVDSAYPGTSTIPGPDLDNPFPLAMPLQVWTWDGWGGERSTSRSLSGAAFSTAIRTSRCRSASWAVSRSTTPSSARRP